jgi:hypothetical protein
MKGTFFRILAIAMLIVGPSLGSAAYASDDNETKFTGVIESLPNTAGFVGDWRVSGRTVHVTAATRIEQEDGRVAVGATVKVEGNVRSDNSVDAQEIEVKQGDNNEGEVKFKGTIETLPATSGFVGDWRVGGRTIHVSSSTRIETEDGPVAVGAFVEIEGTQRADGSMDAAKIEVKSNVAGGDGRDELKGTIESLPNTAGFTGSWRVSGRTINVSAATFLDQEHGPIAIGAFVEVKGTVRVDGSIDATKIEVKSASSGSSDEGQSAKLKGTIQNLPGVPGLIGDWVINDRVVHVTSSTRLAAEHGAFTVGTRVKVKGLRLADGSIVATKVQVRDSK